jgi:hypothetical protein
MNGPGPTISLGDRLKNIAEIVAADLVQHAGVPGFPQYARAAVIIAITQSLEVFGNHFKAVDRQKLLRLEKIEAGRR